ncbi:MAG: hypothetical protein RMJ43_02005 [Chloroherpetonaceae bacterium]|nr:hypothetical protein [Chthonomonadaceae bacterium]MDW8206581.1 hypothetical protein [Chloroherpetonaceae bacterium]
MEWQAIVMAIQILMLAISWVLFQKARAELSAKAAESPVLSEVRALQKQVKALLAEITEAGETASARLEAQCATARDLTLTLQRLLEEAQQVSGTPSARRSPRRPSPAHAKTVPSPEQAEIASSHDAPCAVVASPMPDRAIAHASATHVLSSTVARRQSVYALADQGQPAAEIARQTGLSEGEVETLLGLRPQRC